MGWPSHPATSAGVGGLVDAVAKPGKLVWFLRKYRLNAGRKLVYLAVLRALSSVDGHINQVAILLKLHKKPPTAQLRTGPIASPKCATGEQVCVG